MEKYVWKTGEEAPFITSRQNSKVVSTAKLADKKYREASGLFLSDGVKLTLEASRFGLIKEVFVRESSAENHLETVVEAKSAGAEIFVLSDAAFDKITGEKSPQGIIGTAEMKLCQRCDEYFGEGKNILFLDSVRDPGNLGTILRSAAAMGNVAVVLFSCADLYNPKTVRAAMGAVFKLEISLCQNGAEYIKLLNSKGRRTIAACLKSDSFKLGEFEKRIDDCIIIGNEGHGISDEILSVCSDTVIIPMNENTESLNAAVAASIILWEYATH